LSTDSVLLQVEPDWLSNYFEQADRSGGSAQVSFVLDWPVHVGSGRDFSAEQQIRLWTRQIGWGRANWIHGRLWSL